MKKSSTSGTRLSSIFIAYAVTFVFLAVLNAMEGNAIMVGVDLAVFVGMAFIAIGCRESQGEGVQHWHVTALKTGAGFVAAAAAIVCLAGIFPYSLAVTYAYVAALLAIQANLYQRQLERVVS